MADPSLSRDLPQDARVIIEILKSMGVESYEPRVVNQLLEVMYRYITDALSDARTYSEHANKGAIDIDDVKLAIQSRVNFSFTQPPPREVLLELAKQRNAIPLPEIELRPGLRLPPDVDSLTAPNYQIATPDERPQTKR